MFINLLIIYSLAYTPTTTCNPTTSYIQCDDLDEENSITIGTGDNDVKLTSSYGQFACCTRGIAKPITITVDIPTDTFYKSTKVNKVILTSGVKSIGKGAFYGCTNLEIETLFNSALNSISESAFEGCIKLSAPITFSGISIGKNAFKDCSSLTSSLTIVSRTDSTTQTISESAFEGTHISAFTPGNTIRTIDDRAFYSTDITSPLAFTDKLVKIGDEAFMNTKVSSLSFAIGNSYTFSIGDHAFENTRISGTGTLTIPEACNSIGDYAFARIPFAGSVSLCTKLNKIPDYLFYNSSIIRVTYNNGPATGNAFHKNIGTIGAHAFDRSELKGTVDLGQYIRTIEAYAFKSTKIDGTINLPDSLTTIEKFAFYNCSGINGPIVLHDLVSKVGDRAFEGTLISGPLTLKSTLTTFGIGVFARTKLTELNININVPESTFEGVDTITNLYVHGDSTITLGKNAFKNCIIASVMEFNDVTINTDAFFNARFNNATTNARVYFENCEINSYAFRNFQISNCLINLTDTTLGSSAFETLVGQPRVLFHHIIDNDVESIPSAGSNIIGPYAFYNTRIQGNLEIPDFVHLISSYAFAYCTGLTGYLNVNATYIAQNAFFSSGFTNSLTLGSNVMSFNVDSSYTGSGSPLMDYSESLTFRGCKFNQVSLANSGSIPYRAFYQMTSIGGGLYIPVTVTSIGVEAFAGCTEITSLTFESDPNPNKIQGSTTTTNGNVLSIGNAAFMGCQKIKNALVINRALSDSKISQYAFYDCKGIPSLSFETRLQTIESHAFYHCTGLTSVSFPIELTSIGYNAFAECTSLAGSLIIPYSTSIGTGAFMNCAQLTGDLDLSSATSIGGSAFSGCTGLDGTLSLYNKIFSPISSASIGGSAFYGCRNLKGSLPLKCFSYVGASAFYDCSGLDGNLTFGSFSIQPYTFYRCSGLKGSISLSSYVGKYAFYECSSLSGELIVPDGVSYIGEYAFAGCSGLSGALELPGSLNFIGKRAFSKCTRFSDHLSITVGNTRYDDGSNTYLRIEERAFEGCSGFKNGYLSIYVDDDEIIDHRSSSFSESQLTKGTNGNEESYSTSRGYQSNPHYRYDYFLRIQNEAFDGTKFKNIYYNGRFQPDCDFDIGISSIKGIHTSANYANKTFCGNPVHKSKLSGGAIAGIVIACIVVVAAIVVLIVFLILRNKKNKDNSEGEVEMNNEP